VLEGPGPGLVRSVGIARAKARIGLNNLACNIRRAVQLDGLASAGAPTERLIGGEVRLVQRGSAKNNQNSPLRGTISTRANTPSQHALSRPGSENQLSEAPL
tara:strand:+ start:441 stop:746 length:306 start_codon:yes stop_codon:yes gene_type:complete